MDLISSVSAQDKIDFVKDLSMMLKNGIAIDEAVASLAEQASPGKFQNILEKIQKELRAGTSLTDAFIKEEKTFGSVFVALVRAGEASGTLYENLEFLSSWLERNNDLKKDIRAATLYPKIVLAIAVVIGGGLATMILPKLIPLFKSLRVDLPFATRVVMQISYFLQEYWHLVLVGIIATFATSVGLNKIKSVRRFLQNIYLKIPFFGEMIREYELSIIAQLLTTLFHSGVALDAALEIVLKASSNVPYHDALEKIRQRANGGTKLSKSMQNFPQLFPKNFVSIVAGGEKSGSLQESFDYLSKFYSKEIKNKTKQLPTVIEPILLIFIALVVGFIALSIITPIYKMTSSITR